MTPYGKILSVLWFNMVLYGGEGQFEQVKSIVQKSKTCYCNICNKGRLERSFPFFRSLQILPLKRF